MIPGSTGINVQIYSDTTLAIVANFMLIGLDLLAIGGQHSDSLDALSHRLYYSLCTLAPINQYL
jgi:hypothetical protein